MQNKTYPSTVNSQISNTRNKLIIPMAIFLSIILLVIGILLAVYTSGWYWCKKGYVGKRCEECDLDFHRQFGVCVEGNCSEFGTFQRETNGTCTCKDNFKGSYCGFCLEGLSGEKCDICEAGFHKSNHTCVMAFSNNSMIGLMCKRLGEK